MIVKRWISRFQCWVAVTQAVFPGVAAAAISLGIWQLGGWQPLEQIGSNYLFKIRQSGMGSAQQWDDSIALIAIDNVSLQKYGSFPWPRYRYAQLLQALKASPPAAIGFDVLFVDRGKGDAEFAKAIAASHNVVLATAWDEQGNPLEPLPQLQKAGATVGQIWHNPDPDGISRRTAVFAKDVPGLGVTMLQVGNRGQHIPQPIPGKQKQSVWLNWPHDAKALPTYSFTDVVEGKVPPEALADKLVLVGVTATGIDVLRSPLNQTPPISGVYLHAALLDNLLQSRLLQPLAEELIWVVLVVLGVGSSWVLSHQKIGGRLAIAVLSPAIWMSIAVAAFSYYQLWLPIAAPIGTLLLTWGGVQLQEKQKLMSLFEKYVAPKIARLIWQQQTKSWGDEEIPPQQTIATILFMDIRGFTNISEAMMPVEVFEWLNPYLESMTNCIMDRGGVVDKYIGDAIMAVFGISGEMLTPKAIREGALNAIAACMDMHRSLGVLNQRFEQEGKPLIKVGIGIHTGLVMAGNLGSKRRLNYSVVGDTVNVAARLESMNKEVKDNNPYHLLISSTTYDYVGDRYVAKPIKSLQLRGRKQKTLIYSILGEKPQTQTQQDLISSPLASALYLTPPRP